MMSSENKFDYTAHWHFKRYNHYDPHIALQSCRDMACDLSLENWDAVDLLYLGNSFKGYSPPMNNEKFKEIKIFSY